MDGKIAANSAGERDLVPLYRNYLSHCLKNSLSTLLFKSKPSLAFPAQEKKKKMAMPCGMQDSGL